MSDPKIEFLGEFACCMEDVIKTLEYHTEQAFQQIDAVDFDKRLRGFYSKAFPKKCNTCNELYPSREVYLDKTEALNPRHMEYGTVVDYGRIIEYRNCQCGSTLVIVTDCRRGLAFSGIHFRNYFDDCVIRLSRESNMPKEAAVTLARLIFREVYNHLLSQKLKSA